MGWITSYSKKSLSLISLLFNVHIINMGFSTLHHWLWQCWSNVLHWNWKYEWISVTLCRISVSYWQHWFSVLGNWNTEILLLNVQQLKYLDSKKWSNIKNYCTMTFPKLLLISSLFNQVKKKTPKNPNWDEKCIFLEWPGHGAAKT